MWTAIGPWLVGQDHRFGVTRLNRPRRAAPIGSEMYPLPCLFGPLTPIEKKRTFWTMAQYDFIIIGAGSAGCVLANRLSENPKHRVLLLEAGGPDTNPFIHIPAGYAKTLVDPKVNWLFKTEPDPGTNNRTHVWPRGKVLGGSSAINGMLYIRGQAQDYDLWRQLGNTGWAWDDVLPYFKRSEDQERGANDAHGVGGPMHVSDIKDAHPLSDAVIRAGVEAGLPNKKDPNDGDQQGISYFQLNVKRGKRVSAAGAYLRPAMARSNLHVETDALVKQILFKGTQATGVIFTKDTQTRQALAGREVIVSGGAINSPQILQLSGVGPVDLLKSKGIKVVHGLPGVGENLQDHFIAGLQYRIKNMQTVNEISRGLPLVREVFKYLFARRGLMTLSPVQVQAYVKSRDDLETPDIQFLIFPASMDGDKFSVEGKFELDRTPGMTIAPVILRPESRGWVRIKSDDHEDPPAILPNYLDAAYDQKVIVEGLKWGRKIVAQPALDPYRGEELNPGEDIQSDEDLLAYARKNGSTIYHPVGTCKMGADAMAVVDDQLRVHGLSHLRVVDASIMPRLISGNTNAPTIMIAEKAADMILNGSVAT